MLLLRDGEDVEAIDQDAQSDGTFEFEVEADSTITYVVRIVYDAIQYFSNPLLISPELPTAIADFEVYATTATAPVLEIEETTVTLLAIDRVNSELTLIREDLLRLDEPVIYVGGTDGVTLRLPAPDNTVDAGGLEEDGAVYEFVGGVLTIATPLRPGVTSVVTRYTVRYEPEEDEYRLRITAPLPTDHIEIRVPERFVREVHPQSDDAAFAPDADFQGEPLTVVERTTPAGPGQGLVIDLEGLSRFEIASNPLNSRGRAIIGAVLALIVFAAIAIGLQRRIPERPS